MVTGFEKVNNKVTGSIKDSTGKEMYKVTTTEINQQQAIVNFTGSQGSDVPLTLEKKDEDHVTGNIIRQFTAFFSQ